MVVAVGMAPVVIVYVKTQGEECVWGEEREWIAWTKDGEEGELWVVRRWWLQETEK